VILLESSIFKGFSYHLHPLNRQQL